MCFSPRDVNTLIGSSGVFNDNNVPNPRTFFTGESSFQADDLEVFTLVGRNLNSCQNTEVTLTLFFVIWSNVAKYKT